MNGTRRFATNHLNNSRMRVAQSGDGDPAKKIEIFFPGRVKYITTLASFQYKRLPLVGWQQKVFRVGDARIALRPGKGFHSPMLRRVCAQRSHRFFGSIAHHAADSAVCAELRGSRITKVPGTPGPLVTSWRP